MALPIKNNNNNNNKNDDEEEKNATHHQYCISFQDVQDAAERIDGIAIKTPVMSSQSITKAANRQNLFFKVEALQRTGSFKFRGAVNAITSLLENEEEKEEDGGCSDNDDDTSNDDGKPFAVVAHSSGNHAQAVALATSVVAAAAAAAGAATTQSTKKRRRRPVSAYIAMPKNTPLVKKKAVSAFGGNIVETENSNQAREDEADRLVAQYAPRSALVHPSEDPKVIAGQGTVCLELVQQARELLKEQQQQQGIVELLDAVIIPVGGGGLASGNTITLRAMLGNKVKIILAEPQKLDDAKRSFDSGELLRHDPTNNLDSVADGLKTTLGPNTWPIVRDLVDDIMTVSEYEILSATKLCWERLKVAIEPSAGVGIAVALSSAFQDKYPSQQYRNIGCILCGGNVDIVKISSKMEALGL